MVPRGPADCVLRPFLFTSFDSLGISSWNISQYNQEEFFLPSDLVEGTQLMSIDINSLRDLPVAEKLRIVTQLWDDIATSGEPIVVPQDVMQEVVRRSAELKTDPSLAIDDDELWRRVDG